MGNGAHSIIPPSSAARRMQCRGSAAMERQFPSEETEASREGTRAHEIAAVLIEAASRGIAPAHAARPDDVPDDMWDGAVMYAEVCQEVMREAGVFGGPHMAIEQRVDIPRIHPGSWGTPDFWVYNQRGLKLTIVDFKFGHRVVEVRDNPQLIEYAIGVFDSVTEVALGLEDQYHQIELITVQPRALHRDGTVRRWQFPASDLRAWANILAVVERESLEPDAPCVTGPECVTCSARGHCLVAQQASAAAMAYAGQQVPMDLDGGALGLELRLLQQAEDALKARRTALEAHAEGLLRSGHAVPGWSLEPTYGRQKWSVPAAEVFQLGDMLGVELRNAPTPITPKQAIKAGIDASVISAYSETPSTGLKLVQSTDTAVAAVFTRS